MADSTEFRQSFLLDTERKMQDTAVVNYDTTVSTDTVHKKGTKAVDTDTVHN